MREGARAPETATTGRALELEDYVEGLFAGEDELLGEIRRETERRGFPVIHVPPVTGRALQVLLMAVGARKVLELGTLTGYSAVWMGRALPTDGHLLTLEAKAEAAALARRFLERAGLAEVAEVREGRAETVLPDLGPDEGWDAVFLDADKEGMVGYAREAARLLRPGGLLLADNALWKGRVLAAAEEGPAADDDPRGALSEENDTDARAVHAFNRAVAQDDRYAATILPVGDGLLAAVRI